IQPPHAADHTNLPAQPRDVQPETADPEPALLHAGRVDQRDLAECTGKPPGLSRSCRQPDAKAVQQPILPPQPCQLGQGQPGVFGEECHLADAPGAGMGGPCPGKWWKSGSPSGSM